MRITAFALVVSCLTAGAAIAGPAPSAQDTAANVTQQRASSLREVYVCGTDNMTRRSFAREFGRADYVTARAAVAKGEAWAAPKCMTAAEVRRLKSQKLASTR